MAVDAKGCGSGFGATAPQCIRQVACGITFQSPGRGGIKPAINGSAALQSDGTFTGAALAEGNLNRTGCAGAWDAATSTMTVDCGGAASTQSCILALKRTGICLLP